MGFGNKVKVPQKFSNNIGTATKDCPFYDPLPKESDSVSLRKGKTFGLGWKSYDKARAPHRSTVHTSSQVQSSPGPQHYNAINSGKYSSPEIKMH